MIVASLLLIAGAASLLVLGLWQSSSVLLSASIAASVLAAITLVVGARRAADRLRTPASFPAASAAPTGRSGRTPAAAAPPSTNPTAVTPTGAKVAADAGPPAAASPAFTIPVQGAPARDAAVRAAASPPTTPAGSPPPAQGVADPDDEDPPDEPAPQQVSAGDAARVSRLHTEVLVVDGRPRYHLPGCVHLLGRESEPLPVAEAIELGFTPCSLCEPDSALLADARRV